MLVQTISNTASALISAMPQVFEGQSISTLDQGGQLWFVASDVAKALGYRDANQIVRYLDEQEVGYANLSTLGGNQRMRTINESGLYHLTFRSKKPAAQRFRKWVTGEVIPAIRKNGGYVAGQELLPAAEQIQTTQTIKQEAQRVGGVNAEEEREARWNGFRALKGKSTYYSGKF